MAKSMIDAPKKMKPESGLQRRNSTGGAAQLFSEPIPIPNYLRASIGSCHDLCKYGTRRHSSSSSSSSSTTHQRRNTNINTKSNTNNRATTSMEQRCRNKNNMESEPKSKTNSSAESAITEQRRSRNMPKSNTNNSAPSGTKRQSTCNARVMTRNNETKRVNSLPRTTSSDAKIPTAKTRRSRSVPRKVPKSGSEKLLESSECSEKSEQSVEEKIINVVETNDDDQSQNQNEDVGDESQKMDSATNDSCSRKLGLVDEDGINWKDIRLRRVVSEGDSDNMRKECMRIVVMGKNKVRALVDSFETLINTPNSQGSRASSTSP